MSTDKWNQIKPVILDALEVDVFDRTRFLAGRVADPDLRQEIEELLSLEESSKRLMNISAAEYAFEMVADAEDNSSMAGVRVGPYQISAELGGGGMGAVYLAHRSDGKFDRVVAIKMLRREFNSERIRQRFKQEKDIQAKLLHPNIAALIDAGTTDDRIPFLVMEYVDGTPIDRYCELNDLGLRDRLKLFNKVCDAVSFAHRNLIVHSDLKPSNILVTKTGEPKLLDFGISKLLDAPSSGDHALTNSVAMTPQYASPEQVSGDAVTTSTDIYSLGIVLFKLLTGTYPYNVQSSAKGQLLREITDSKSIRPSDALTRRHSLSDRVAPVIQAAELKGDLDLILSKAIRKEPERRYESVEQFSSDIWRYIDGQPVKARPATLRYRAEKFVLRNKIAVASACVVMISLICGVVVAGWQASRAREQASIANEARHFAESETSKARTEQSKSERITRFMSRIISYANPAWYAEGSRFGGNARVIDAINDLSDKIDTEFAAEADIAAELHHKFGEVFLWVEKGETGQRLEQLRHRRRFHAERALELRKSFYGERHELVAKDMFYAYGVIHTSRDASSQMLAEAIIMMRETNPHNLNLPYMHEAYAAHLLWPKFPDEEDVFMANRLIIRSGETKYQAAERLLEEAIPIFREHYPDNGGAVLQSVCRLAYVKIKQGKIAEAQPLIELCKGNNDYPLVKSALQEQAYRK